MSNAMICVSTSEEYRLHYRDSHGQPTELGTELISALRHNDVEDALRSVGAASLGQWVHYPEHAFQQVRQDIEWIYTVSECPATNAKTLEIYKTSYGCTRRRFAWKVWGGEVNAMDKVAAVRLMEAAEVAAVAVLQALNAFERAGSRPGVPTGGTGPQEMKEGSI